MITKQTKPTNTPEQERALVDSAVREMAQHRIKSVESLLDRTIRAARATGAEIEEFTPEMPTQETVASTDVVPESEQSLIQDAQEKVYEAFN